MRRSPLFLLLSLAACGSTAQLADAGTTADAPVDAAPACSPTLLLAGGRDVQPQGWSIVMQQPATLGNGADHAALQTATGAGATTSGQLLLGHAGAVEPGTPFKIQIVMLVEQVNAHNPSDSAAAILGSFTAPFGNGGERAQMIYLDADRIGWADGTGAFPFAVTDGAYHTYELSVDASGGATVSVDGAPALTRAGFTVNGTIAVGDQTNDVNVDSTLRIRSVTKLCP